MKFENISESNQKYLQFMKDIFEISEECSIRTYIWGGFTSDIFEGKFLREHHDLDCFTQNLVDNLEVLMDKYKARGYFANFRHDINMLEIRNGNEYASINSLDIDQTVAMWRHIGNEGTVFFPLDWLDKEPRQFYNVKVFTSGLKFEYGFRSIAHSLNPRWKEREEDIVVKKYLNDKIIEYGISQDDVFKFIWSYNPYWIKHGYNPFEKPVLLFPKS
jgi:hypothetical protein